MVTDASGAVLHRYDYSPDGALLSESGSGVPWNRRSWAGKERDVETAAGATQPLDYFGARYYGSQIARFTSPDLPGVDQNPLDPQSWNLYGYVRNNPLRYVDPTGRKCENGYNAETGAFCSGVEAEDPYRRAEQAWRDSQRFFLDSWLNFEGQFPRTSGFLEGSTQAVTTLFTSPRQSCLAQAGLNTLWNLAPIEPGLTDLVEAAAAGAALLEWNRAQRYAASRPNFLGGRGLLYPIRSSVYRGMVNRSKFIVGKAGPVATGVLAIGEAIVAEAAAWQAGTCR